jgi:hypothetical protein
LSAAAVRAFPPLLKAQLAARPERFVFVRFMSLLRGSADCDAPTPALTNNNPATRHLFRAREPVSCLSLSDIRYKRDRELQGPGDGEDFSGIRSRKFEGVGVARAAYRKLAILHSAATLHDLKSPGLQFEALRDDRAGQHSIRINDLTGSAFYGRTGKLSTSKSWTTIRGAPGGASRACIPLSEGNRPTDPPDPPSQCGSRARSHFPLHTRLLCRVAQCGGRWRLCCLRMRNFGTKEPFLLHVAKEGRRISPQPMQNGWIKAV